MFEDYKVSIKLTLINELSAGLLAASAQFKALDVEAESFQSRLKSIKGLAMAGAGMLGGAFAMAAPLIYATSKAAELQKAMLSIQIATTGTAAQMDVMRHAIEKASAPTMFSSMQVANMGKLIATSNTFTAPQLTSLLPEYAKFADVQLILKGTPYQKSIMEAVRLAHTAQIYTPKAMTEYLDTLTKASIMSGGDITALGTALKYSQGTAQTALGVSPQQMILATALANRMGFSGSRGGTNLIDAMIRTMPGVFGSGLLKGRSPEALRAMGFTDSHGHSTVFTDGKFDMMKWMYRLSEYVSKEMSTHPEAIARQDILTNFQHAFGAQGRRIATLFSAPVALQQLQIMHEQFNKLPGNSAIQDIFVKRSVSQQYQTAITNFQNVMIELGTTLLPTATSWLNKFNKEITILMGWMQAHQAEVKSLTNDFLRLGVALAISGTVLLLAAAFSALMTPVGLVITGITFLVHEFGQMADAIKTLYKIWSPSISKHFGSLSSTAANQSDFENVFFSSTNKDNTTHVHHHYLDGKQIASSVTSHQAKEASRQPAHGSNFNTSIGLTPNMLNATGY